MKNFFSFRGLSSFNKFLITDKLIKTSAGLHVRQRNQQLVSQVLPKKHEILRYMHTKPEFSSFPRISADLKKIGWSASAVMIALLFFNYGPFSLLLFLFPLAVLNARDIHIVTKTLKRDLVFAKRYFKCLSTVKSIKRKDLTVIKIFNNNVNKCPHNIMIQMFDESWTYLEIKCYANKVSRVMQKLKLEKGDSVAIFLLNSPEMIATIFGLAQLGIVSALINTNLKQDGLAHCINISSCKVIIVDDALAKALEEVRSLLQKDIKIFQLKGQVIVPDYKKFEDEMGCETSDCPECFNNIHYDDAFVYIYTSGTTGLPKAAIVPNSKFLVNSLSSGILLNLSKCDKIYNPLPLYHTVGLACGIGTSLGLGIPCVIRPKFSAKMYFQECQIYNCTLGLYIGEICRYLLMSKPSPFDKNHKVTKMFGNGLNVEIWPEFAKRFNVVITELYGSTEGNCNMINVDGTVGAVGFVPTLYPTFLHPFYIIRVDDNNYAPIRKSNGLCQLCVTNEPGMMVGMIKKSHLESKYYGYVGEKNPRAHNIIQDVYRKGDSAFVTGDILVRDELNYISFMDRTGDTFRWKGENVSTLDVETVASEFTKQNCACYGVKVKGIGEGRAGMLAIEDPKSLVKISDLGKHLVTKLPTYAVPRFLRVVNEIYITGTFKVKKGPLIKEGLDLQDFKNAYYFDMKDSNYKPLTPQVLDDIANHKISL